MKAVTFLQQVKNFYATIDYLEGLGEISNPDHTRERMVELIGKWEEFYSQPFKPEMITELFEGWEHGTPPENLHFKQWWLYVAPAGKGRGLFQINECNEE